MHGRQFDKDEPAWLLYVPPGQNTHVATVDAPVTVEYDPGTHGHHVPPTHHAPAGHGEQVALDVAPQFQLCVPGGQSRHVVADDAPVAEEYDPPGHDVIMPPAHHAPAGHGEQVALEDPLYIPPGQRRHAAADDAPVVGRYDPVAQGNGEPAPPAHQFPAGQGTPVALGEATPQVKPALAVHGRHDVAPAALNEPLLHGEHCELPKLG